MMQEFLNKQKTSECYIYEIVKQIDWQWMCDFTHSPSVLCCFLPFSIGFFKTQFDFTDALWFV